MQFYNAEKMIEDFIYTWGCCRIEHIRELVHPMPEAKIKRLIKGMLIEEQDGVLKPVFSQLSYIESQRTLKFLDFFVKYLQDRVTDYKPAQYPYVALVRTTKGKDAFVSYVLAGEESVLRDVINTKPVENIIFILENPETKPVLQNVNCKVKNFLNAQNGEKI